MVTKHADLLAELDAAERAHTAAAKKTNKLWNEFEAARAESDEKSDRMSELIREARDAGLLPH